MVVRRWEISDMCYTADIMWLTLGEVNHVTARKENASFNATPTSVTVTPNTPDI